MGAIVVHAQGRTVTLSAYDYDYDYDYEVCRQLRVRLVLSYCLPGRSPGSLVGIAAHDSLPINGTNQPPTRYELDTSARMWVDR
ncbi:hypothetical protein [Actinacidiphila soli]|uniref:hypothetical protein n=1 Tax=Actinacidiphila soli TaxID=2487275 RepID=UPI000FCA5970|nr:hypothetical protein [Actinacidiphila soli]